MTAAMPVRIDPEILKVMIGPISSSPNAGRPGPDRRSGTSTVRRAWKRLKGGALRVLHRAARHRGPYRRPGTERTA